MSLSHSFKQMGSEEKRITSVTVEGKGVMELWKKVKKEQQERGEYEKPEKKRRGVRDTHFF